ncbi:MAG: hypothetical protein COA45_08405 [Zetaproteobacteria bacterium]|nr:MAG: hypothetical protein COA45_08405 [Zetaproteobacteria bacterium]
MINDEHVNEPFGNAIRGEEYLLRSVVLIAHKSEEVRRDLSLVLQSAGIEECDIIAEPSGEVALTALYAANVKVKAVIVGSDVSNDLGESSAFMRTDYSGVEVIEKIRENNTNNEPISFIIYDSDEELSYYDAEYLRSLDATSIPIGQPDKVIENITGAVDVTETPSIDVE